MKDKKELIKIIIAIIFLIGAMLIKIPVISLTLYLISYILVGTEIIFKSIKNILKGEIFDENFLMAIATIGAFLIGEYKEAVLVMVLYQIGEMFQDYAVAKSRHSIKELMNLKVETANLKTADTIKKISSEEIKVNDIIIVKAGEKIPVDGQIIKGESFVDTSSLTGESTLRKVGVNDEVLSGYLNQNNLLEIKATTTYKNSTVAHILKLIEQADNKKASTEKFITKFAHYYTPIVVFLSIFIALVPPLFTNLSYLTCLYRALNFLVISCPCALVISVPLSFFGGIGACSSKGILIKGSTFLEKITKIKTILFDKTGTLTKGVFKVQKINCFNIKEKEFLKIVAEVESFSNHPIALSIIEKYQHQLNSNAITNYEELPGLGIKAYYNQKEILIGNYDLVKKYKVAEVKEPGTIIYVVINSEYKGNIIINDEIKESVSKALNKLRQNNIQNLIMVTGDNEKVAASISKKLKLSAYHASLLPQDKVAIVDDITNNQQSLCPVAFVGDGINDAPVLMRSDIGIAMGAVGSPAALEAADIIIMNDDLNKINECLTIAEKTLRIVSQNIFISLTIKIIFLLLGAFGLTSMMGAVFADVGVSILAILNALRTLKIAK